MKKIPQFRKGATMNREILFRGKCARTGLWRFGYLSNKDVINTDNGRIKIIPATIGQFTGLTDKNGVKIFEGDVLSIEIVDEDSVLGSRDFYTGAVIYGRDYKSTNKGKVTSYPCSFTIHCNDWYMEEGLLGMNNHDVEIIGNINDNPELIKQS